jgi:hypothetical protein
MAGEKRTTIRTRATAPAPIPVLNRGTPERGEAVKVLTSLEEVRAVTNRAAHDAQRLMSIYTPDLEPDLYDQTPFLEIIKRFVLGRSFAKVRVLLVEHSRLISSNNRFLAMARRLTSYIDIRLVAPEYRNRGGAFLIADDRAIVYRLRCDRWEAVAGFAQPPVARLYLQEFDQIWLASAPDREVRVAHR